MKVLLVAKPWRGGLAHYVFDALSEVFPREVQWLATYPTTWTEHLRYRQNKRAWRERLIDRINRTAGGVAVFINHFGPAGALRHTDRNVLWLTDSAMLAPESAPSYTRVFITDPGYEADLKKRIQPEQFAGELPFAHNPCMHRPAKADRDPRGVCLIANRDPKRDPYLRVLIRHSQRLTVFGNYDWRHWLAWRHPMIFKPPVARDHMGAVYARYRATVNIHARVVRHGTNMRTFECAGYRVPQVVEHRPGLENYFDPDQDLLTFHNPQQMINQVDRLLTDPRFAGQLAANAARRAAAQHTYRHRVGTLLQGMIKGV